jgi:hypothetical protein
VTPAKDAQGVLSGGQWEALREWALQNTVYNKAVLGALVAVVAMGLFVQQSGHVSGFRGAAANGGGRVNTTCAHRGADGACNDTAAAISGVAATEPTFQAAFMRSVFPHWHWQYLSWCLAPWSALLRLITTTLSTALTLVRVGSSAVEMIVHWPLAVLLAALLAPMFG